MWMGGGRTGREDEEESDDDANDDIMSIDEDDKMKDVQNTLQAVYKDIIAD